MCRRWLFSNPVTYTYTYYIMIHTYTHVIMDLWTEKQIVSQIEAHNYAYVRIIYLTNPLKHVARMIVFDYFKTGAC